MNAGTRIKVVSGDITKIAADVIVNSANTAMLLSGQRSVAGAILEATEGRVQVLLNRAKRPVPLGDVVVTEGCGLPCRKILHVATHAPLHEERLLAEEQQIAVEALRVAGLMRGVSQALAVAKSLRATSMTLPLLGTGHLRLPVQQASEALVNVLFEDLREPSSLETVTVVVKDPADQAVVERAIADKSIEVKESLRQSAAAPTRTPPFVAGGLAGAAAGRGIGSEATGQQRTGARTELEGLREEVARLRAQNDELQKALEQARAAPLTWELPMPVALAVSLVESDANPVRKSANLRNAFAILLRYLGSIALADYEQSGAQDQEANKFLAQSFRGPKTGDGHWLKVILETGWAQLRQGSKSYFSECPGIWVSGPARYAALTGALNELRELRNDDIHDRLDVSDAMAEQWLQQALPVWRRVLETAAPLFRYRLFYLEGHDGFEGEHDHAYVVRWLAGQSMFPRWERVAWRPRLNKGSVYLIDPSGQFFLKLGPFLEYRPCAVTKANETWCLDLVSEEVTFVTFRFSQKDKSTIQLPRCLS